jgi:hypothetical protein
MSGQARALVQALEQLVEARDAGHEGVERVVAGRDEDDAAGAFHGHDAGLDSYDGMPSPTGVKNANTTQYTTRFT